MGMGLDSASEGSTEQFGLGAGRNRRTWRCVKLGNGLLNGLTMATDRTEEGRETVEEGRQTVSETLHSKTPYSAYNSVFTLTSYKQ